MVIGNKENSEPLPAVQKSQNVIEALMEWPMNWEFMVGKSFHNIKALFFPKKSM